MSRSFGGIQKIQKISCLWEGGILRESGFCIISTGVKGMWSLNETSKVSKDVKKSEKLDAIKN